jgi:hypothetical protein
MYGNILYMNEDNTINETQTSESTQPTQTDSPAPTTDSPVVEMPSKAPESPTNVVDALPNKDDNGAVIPAESQTIIGETKPEELPPFASLPEETPQTSQTPVKSSSFSSGEQTAQMGGNEPIRTQSFIRGLLEKAKLAIQSRKRKKLDKIMNLFAKQTSISNNDVQKLLYVSDATATRYLGILIKEGKIKQEGKTGKAVSYFKI